MNALRHTRIIMVMLSIMGVGTMAHAGVVTKETVETAIVEHLTSVCEIADMDIEFSVPSVADITVSECENPQMTVSNDLIELPVKSIPVMVSVMDEEGTVIKKLRKVVRLRYFTYAVVATTDIKLGDALVPELLEIRRVDVTGLTDYFTSLDGLDGLQTKKYLRDGMVLSSTAVRPAYLIERGDKVAVEVRDGTCIIRTEGTARKGGSLGEKITVYIDMTKTTVSGIVVNEKTVLTGATGG